MDTSPQVNSAPLRIAISGASGMIGTALTKLLRSYGHEIFRLVRSPSSEPDTIFWNILEQEIDTTALEGMDAVVHLAGEPVFAVRWTEEKRRRILESRAYGTRLIATAISELRNKPSVFVSASAIGIYGDRGTD
ncbi:MAG: NAD-dependent epimerase/dehydratase family protein, partial [Rhodothermales bacterium]|nr:NAD-dependent epimerase/dehydratase family protein [Rhodothermales bacterium]